MASSTAKTAVTSAMRRANWSSRRSCSSSGFGSSTSAIDSVGGASPTDLLLHCAAPGLERGRQALRLLLEVLAALVEQVARAHLRLSRPLLRPLEQLRAALRQQVACL